MKNGKLILVAFLLPLNLFVRPSRNRHPWTVTKLPLVPTQNVRTIPIEEPFIS